MICCHYAIQEIPLLSLQFRTPSRVLCTLSTVISMNSLMYAHSLTHKHWHTHMIVHRQVSGCSFWCPSCQVVLLLPGTCHRGDGWLHHQRSPEGNSALKERNHLSILSSAYFSDAPSVSFVLHNPPSPPLHCLLCLHHHHPLSSKPLKMKESLTDVLFQILLRMSLTPQSTRYYHGLPTDLNPNLKRRIWILLLWSCLAVGAEGNSVPFFSSNKSIVFSVNVCSP